MSLISAIVINHNNKEMLIRCIESLKHQSRPPDDILVVDNASTDGSAGTIRERFADIKIIRNDKNLEFSLSCNNAIRLTGGEFILLLNNDLMLAENFIEVLLRIIQADKTIGIAGGKILSYDGVRIDSAGQFLARSRKVIDRGYRETDRGQYEENGFVFGISASCVLYRRAALEDIKEGEEYFDEDFGFFYEDMDLAWRAQRKNWKVYYEPKAVAYHRRGQTTWTKKPSMPFLRKYYLPHLKTELQLCAVRNRYLMILKNDTGRAILKNLPFILWQEIKQAGYILLFNPILLIHMFKNRKSFLNRLHKDRGIPSPGYRK